MPDGYPFGETNFQTKSFECIMITYRITPEGRLESEGLAATLLVVPPMERPGKAGAFPFLKGCDDSERSTSGNHSSAGFTHDDTSTKQGKLPSVLGQAI